MCPHRQALSVRARDSRRSKILKFSLFVHHSFIFGAPLNYYFFLTWGILRPLGVVAGFVNTELKVP